VDQNAQSDIEPNQQILVCFDDGIILGRGDGGGPSSSIEGICHMRGHQNNGWCLTNRPDRYRIQPMDFSSGNCWTPLSADKRPQKIGSAQLNYVPYYVVG